MIKYKNTFIKNIYYMLSYAFMTVNQCDFENVATEEFDKIHNLFAAILAKGIGQQLKQGLYRGYLNLKDDITALHGKLDISGTLHNRLSGKHLLKCEFDNLSENNLMNQILKTTITLLLEHPDVNARYKNELKKEMLFFSNVENVDPARIRWIDIRFHRNNNTYRMLIGLCQLILEGMLMTTETGEYKLKQIVDTQNMEMLYEKFVRNYYKLEYQQRISISASHIPWAINNDDKLREFLPKMKSDIMLEKDQIVLIVDAKLKTQVMQHYYDSDKLHSTNLYQIFTYVKNKDSGFGEQPHTVSGMLLYAATDDDIQPNACYHICGNKISVRTLDLNCNFDTIKEQLNAIVEEHFGVFEESTKGY